MKTEPCNPFNVAVANGDRLICNQQIKRVTWEMAEEKFIADMIVLPVGAMMLFWELIR